MSRMPRALPLLSLIALPALVGFAMACGSDEEAVTPPPPECGTLDPIPCALDIGATLPFSRDGSTAGEEDSFGGARCGLGGDTIEDFAFRWTAPADDTYLLTTEGSHIDTFLSVRRDGCFGREIACNDDASPDERHSAIELDLSACETVVIVVDGPSVDAVGDFRLTIRGTEKVCDDGIDEDGDGATDCADPDCFSASCPGDDLWPPPWNDIEWEILTLVNEHRAAGATCVSGEQAPAPLLEMDETLRLAARLHSEDMLENDYFDHVSLDGRMLQDRLSGATFTGAAPFGENIARGTRSAASAVAGWMASPDGHCENTMNPSFRVLGVGYTENAADSRVTQNFARSH